MDEEVQEQEQADMGNSQANTLQRVALAMLLIAVLGLYAGAVIVSL